MEWPRGEAAACKAAYTGSNPVSTSIHRNTPSASRGRARAIGAVVARFLDTEEVTGSNPVSTSIHPNTPSASRGRARAIGAVVARFLDTEEVFVSNDAATTENR